MRNPLRIAQAVRAFYRIVVDPDRLDEVFDLADGLADPAQLRRMADDVRRHPEGAAALAERPRLDVDLAQLRLLPLGTLGRTFADHMIENGLDPAAIPTLPADDGEAFVRAHLYETHDVWHVVTGFRTDVAGELGLQAFYAAQLVGNLPTALLTVGLLNTLLFRPEERTARLDAIARGWELGRRARPFFGVRWDKLWTTPLDDVRRALGVDGPVALAA